MIGTDWHVDPDDLAEYAGGRAGPVRLASIESHLGRCASCRAALTVHVDARRALPDDARWAAISDRVDVGNWMLRRSTRLATVSLASPPLAIATALLAGLLIVLVVVARLGSARYATTILVTLGPIAPLAGAHVAFGTRVDPAGRMAAAVPLAAGRVAAIRALVATVIACATGVLVSPLTTLSLADSVVWLLPALAVSALAVAAATFVDAALPTAALAVGWLAAVGAWLGGLPSAARGLSTEGLVSARPAAQLALVAVTLAACAVVVIRGDGDPAWRSQ